MEGRRKISGAGDGVRSELLPFASLVKRELVRNLRRTLPFVWLLLATTVAAVTVVAAYPHEVMTPTLLRTQSWLIFSSFTAVFTLVALVVVPAYASAAIVTEREQDTFDLLSLTLVRPSMILLGKLASVLGLFVLIECAMLPIVASAFFLIGVDVPLMAQTAVGLLVIATTGACAGILSSTYVRGTPRAILGGYALTAILLIGYSVPFGPLAYVVWTQSEWLGQYAYTLVDFLVNLSPFSLLGSVREWEHVVIVVLAQGLFEAACLVAAWRLLRRKSEERGYSTVAVSQTPAPAPSTPASALSVPPPLPSERTAAAFSGPDSGSVRAPRVFGELPPWPSVPDGANPLYRRELRQLRVSQRLTPLRALAGGLFIVPAMILSAYIAHMVGTDETAANLAVGAWLLGIAVLMAFVTPAASATTWSREYERETADLLRMSLLTPYEMVLGKFKAALVASAFPLLIALPASWPLLVLVFAAPNTIVVFGLGVVTILVTVVECVAVSMWLGMFPRKTTAAILYGYAGVLFVMFNSVLVGFLRVLPYGFLLPFALLTSLSSPISAYAIMNVNRFVTHGILWSVAMALHAGVAVLVLRAAHELLLRRHMAER